MSPYLSLIDLTLPTAFLATADRTESGAIHRLDKTRAGIKKKIATLRLNFRQEAAWSWRWHATGQRCHGKGDMF